MEHYARRVARDKAVARRRSLARRLGSGLVRKYLNVVPSVFSSRGVFQAFEVRVPVDEAMRSLGDSGILTLDSATEHLGGFRFGPGGHIYAYCHRNTLKNLDRIVRPLAGSMSALMLARSSEPILFTVCLDPVPPHFKTHGKTCVTVPYLVRELIGFYGLRLDLLAELEHKLHPLSAEGPHRRDAI